MNRKKKSILEMSFFKANGGPLIALLILLLLATVGLKNFLTVSNITTVSRQLVVNILLAFGVGLAIISGNIDLSVGAHVAFAGCVLCLLMNELGLPFALALLVTLLLGALIGAVIAWLINKTGMVPFVATLAMQYLLRGSGYLITHNLPINCADEAFKKWGTGFVAFIPIPVIVVIVVAIVYWLILNRTKFGRYVYAMGGNADAARFAGIDIHKIRTLTFIISGVFAALAGSIHAARMYSGQPDSAQGFEGDAIAAAVLGGTSFSGGKGTAGGIIIGAMIIGVMNNCLNMLHASTAWQQVAKGLVLILAIWVDQFKNRERPVKRIKKNA